MEIKIGDKKGKFIVIDFIRKLNGENSCYLICQCECGNKVRRSKGDWIKSPQRQCAKCKEKHLPLTEEQKQLAENYFKWAIKQIRPLQRRYPSLSDEIESITSLALIYAAEKYDKNKTHGHSMFNKFAKYSIKSQLSVLWKSKYFKEKSNEEDIFNILEDEERNEYGELIQVDVSFLSEKQRFILQKYYFESVSLEEIASSLNCTKQNVHALKAKAIKKLRGKYGVGSYERTTGIGYEILSKDS